MENYNVKTEIKKFMSTGGKVLEFHLAVNKHCWLREGTSKQESERKKVY